MCQCRSPRHSNAVPCVRCHLRWRVGRGLRSCLFHPCNSCDTDCLLAKHAPWGTAMPARVSTWAACCWDGVHITQLWGARKELNLEEDPDFSICQMGKCWAQDQAQTSAPSCTHGTWNSHLSCHCVPQGWFPTASRGGDSTLPEGSW